MAVPEAALAARHVVDRPKPRLTFCLFMVALVFMIVAGVFVFTERPYKLHSDFAYWLGVLGASMMLILFAYPLRKRCRWLNCLGPVRYWFRLHMFCGFFGPLTIAFHSNFSLQSVNATVAVVCMALVAVSGIVGRFLYRRIHRGLYGSRMTLEETRDEFQKSVGNLKPKLRRFPELRRLLESFAHVVNKKPTRLHERVVHFFVIGWQRRKAVSVAKRMLSALNSKPVTDRESPRLSPTELASLLDLVQTTCAAMQRSSQFSGYEKLFSLWHVAHVPFVYLFVLTAIVHVAAVHVY